MPKLSKYNESNLIEAYQIIAKRYSQLKKKPWKDFLSYYTYLNENFNLPESGILVDLGSGNGRNLLVFTEQSWHFIASDFSFELLKVLVPIEKERISLINNDMRKIPLRENSVNFVLCIASIHHLYKEEDVVKTLNNIADITKKDGFVIISCWRRWKKGSKNRMVIDLLLYPIKKIINKNWRYGDIFLPWINDQRQVIAKRYYHLFTRKELVRVVEKSKLKICNITRLGGKGEKDNYFLLLKK
ncbi:MAG: class I SAM-dependent methyltransferase [Candidatus Thorarchaeota archaeon]